MYETTEGSEYDTAKRRPTLLQSTANRDWITRVVGRVHVCETQEAISNDEMSTFTGYI